MCLDFPPVPPAHLVSILNHWNFSHSPTHLFLISLICFHYTSPFSPGNRLSPSITFYRVSSPSCGGGASAPSGSSAAESRRQWRLLTAWRKLGATEVNTWSSRSTSLIIMRKITGKHLMCLFLLVLPLSWAVDTKKGVRKTENDTVWSQAKTRPLFARRKVSPSQESHIPKHNKSDAGTPVRRCGHLMESCSSRVPCCDPCASCRCRLFNTICHCWRMNHQCLKKT
ncbi:hypothetical protein INR49_013936 [Caranx melampygus]|nr:hypothetical protein INR49_013936 [Caranx melampygus]